MCVISGVKGGDKVATCVRRLVATGKKRWENLSHGPLVYLDKTTRAHNTNHHDSQAQTQIDSFIHKSYENQSHNRRTRFASTAIHVSHYLFLSGLQPDVCMCECKRGVKEELTSMYDNSWWGRCLQSALSLVLAWWVQVTQWKLEIYIVLKKCSFQLKHFKFSFQASYHEEMVQI